jgi:hypothetical protein
MALVSLIMTILVLALHSSAGALERSGDRALFGIRLLRADSLIRSRIGAVTIPYWETPVMEAGESSVIIPWYQGERDGYVRLLAEDDMLIMETEDKKKKERMVLLTGLDGAELSVLRDDRRLPCGIGVTYFHKQKTYHTLSAFSSIPLTGYRP